MNLQEKIIREIDGKGIPMPGNNIDTDQIIPARFMKCLTFEGLGKYAFYDERFDENGNPKPHPFNDVKYAGHDILVVGANFGCGSSREHAPQALRDAGVRAVVGESFAEIFAGNCTAMGIPVVLMRHDDSNKVMTMVRQTPEVEIHIDVENSRLTIGEHTFTTYIPDTFKNAFLAGTWDTTAVLLANNEKITAKAGELPYVGNFAYSGSSN